MCTKLNEKYIFTYIIIIKYWIFKLFLAVVSGLVPITVSPACLSGQIPIITGPLEWAWSDNCKPRDEKRAVFKQD